MRMGQIMEDNHDTFALLSHQIMQIFKQKTLMANIKMIGRLIEHHNIGILHHLDLSVIRSVVKNEISFVFGVAVWAELFTLVVFRYVHPEHGSVRFL